MKKGFITALLPLILVGCVTTAPTTVTKPVEPEKNAADIARTSLDYPGTYRAKLACDDCEYINAQLQINPYGQYRYIEQSVKNGGPVGQPIMFQGRYVWDQKVPIIRLLNGRNMHFFVAENQVVLLSKPVTSYAEIGSDPKFEKVIR